MRRGLCPLLLQVAAGALQVSPRPFVAIMRCSSRPNGSRHSVRFSFGRCWVYACLGSNSDAFSGAVK